MIKVLVMSYVKYHHNKNTQVIFLTNMKKVGLMNIISFPTTTKVSIFQIFINGINPSNYQLKRKYD